MPNCVASFHKDLVNDALKFSNLSYIYNKKMKNFILKSKSNGLFNINIYVKALPYLSYGIISLQEKATCAVFRRKPRVRTSIS